MKKNSKPRAARRPRDYYDDDLGPAYFFDDHFFPMPHKHCTDPDCQCCRAIRIIGKV
jgi:hypothetical protein